MIGATAITVAAAAGMVSVASGMIAANAARNAPAQDSVAAPVDVATARLVLQSGYSVPAEVLGRIEPRRSAALGFEAGGTLAEVFVDEGDSISYGQVIARLDTRALESERLAVLAAHEAALAAEELARLTAERQETLAAKDHVSAQRYDEARLALAQASAGVRRLEAQIVTLDVAVSKSEITAPFAGQVARRFADEGARLAPGAQVIELLEAGAPVFRAGLSPDLIPAMQFGKSYPVTLGATLHDATLTALRPDISAGTRTVDAQFTLAADAPLPVGMLGHLHLERRVGGQGAWVPLTAIGEGIRGLWTLYLVDESAEPHLVRREAVNLLYADEERAFVAGQLAGGFAFVQSGIHRIADGQSVAPIQTVQAK
ncbi:MAG: efflux RND transporter periplasmic adaptor subunit [Alphaproteobacteria bacterium]|nr:efflux RND transporter periplasmic adaptor subunit [Alphaproteobacteria bacterium]NNF23946.1 efflux RND transporter periplasmic adaptor subunit [Paracoccaceae bacterium]